MAKRLDRIDIAAANPDESLLVYRRNFALEPVASGPDARWAQLERGGVAIRLVRAEIDGEADVMGALWLETADAGETLAVLSAAGVRCGPFQVTEKRRFFEVDRRFTNGVQLFVFDHGT